MDENIQKELTWASGALVAFVVFLIYGGISDLSEMVISVGAFGVSWIGVSYFIKNFGSGGTSKQDLEKEFQWYAGMLILFLAIMTLIGKTDDELELTSSIYGMFVFGFTLIWVIRSTAIKYFHSKREDWGYGIESMEIKVDKTATTLLYILSFLIPLAGFIVGAIYLSKEEEHYKHVGKNCLIFSVMNIVIGFIMVALLFA